MFKQTINYFNVAIFRRGITFNQVKAISRVPNLQQFFAVRGRTVKSLFVHALAFGFVFLSFTVNINAQMKLIKFLHKRTQLNMILVKFRYLVTLQNHSQR